MERSAYAEMIELEAEHWWFRGRRAIIQRVLSRMIDGANDDGERSVLEIGCGSGGNFEMLSRFGTLTGIEMDAEMRRVANERDVCTVLDGSLPEALPVRDTFDLVCMLDVLEHIEQDEPALGRVFEAVSPGGQLLVTVPAYQFLWSSHDVANHHYRRYTRRSLTGLAKKVGFRVRYATYMNSTLFPLIAGLRLLGKLRPKPVATDLSLPHPVINGTLERLFGGERHVMPTLSLPAGVSVLMVCERPVADTVQQPLPLPHAA